MRDAVEEAATVVTDLGADEDVAAAVVLQRDGRIVVAGHRGPDLALARYSGDATPPLGRRPARRRPPRRAHGCTAMRAPEAGFALVRLRRDGALDRSFGTDGIAVSSIGYGVHALALDRRGRIVTAGRTTSLLDFVVARFLPDGRRDRSFATTVTDFDGTDTPFRLALQRDGKIVVAGASSPGSGALVGDIVVARYLASG